VEREVFGHLIDWATDAQTIRQLVRTCHRTAAPAAEHPSIAESSAAAGAVAEQHAVANGNGSVPAPPADAQTAEAVPETAPAVAAAHNIVGEDVAAPGSSSSSLPEQADGSQDAAATAAVPADLAAGEAAQSADRRRKAHGAAQRQLLAVLRPLAQRALLEAQRPPAPECVAEAELFV